ncbi:MAG: hypothetical protein U0271_32165 [Polyangiaceae bacterium]
MKLPLALLALLAAPGCDSPNRPHHDDSSSTSPAGEVDRAPMAPEARSTTREPVVQIATAQPDVVVTPVRAPSAEAVADPTTALSAKPKPKPAPTPTPTPRPSPQPDPCPACGMG